MACGLRRVCEGGIAGSKEYDEKGELLRTSKGYLQFGPNALPVNQQKWLLMG